MFDIIFFGTQEFAAGILQALIDSGNFNIKLVVTRPDRPVGRKQEIQKPTVKLLAEQHSLNLAQPESVAALTETILIAPKVELNILCQYGFIIPKKVLDAPARGSINIHPSLLPKYRGATPIQSALLNGDTTTGVSIMLMDEQLDHGPILAQKGLLIEPADTYAVLSQKLLKMAKILLLDTIPKWLNNQITPQPQNHALATFCGLLKRADGQIDWQKNAGQVYNQYRAYTPWPGVWTTLDKQRLKLLQIKIRDTELAGLKPGEIKIEDKRALVACGQGTIEVIELQLEGRKPGTAGEFVNGYRGIKILGE